MQYNLLYYGNTISSCTSSNNSMSFKEDQLSVLIDHFKPDIFTANEMGASPELITRLLNNAFNVNEKGAYRHAAYTNLAKSNIVNAMYYNSDKLVLYREYVVNTILRDINLYTLYLKTEDLAFGGDTIFITCLVAHLKAGQEASDQQQRTAMVNNAMNFLNSNGYKGNIIFMGDFNMRSSFEQAYQVLTAHSNPVIRLHDPVNAPGIWSGNSAMAIHHTQSPRTGTHECFVTGGLDDRYDFILASEAIMTGKDGLKFIAGSYKAIGQDGTRYKQSVINPTNYSQPQTIINAIYNISDHLPVIMDMVADKAMVINDEQDPIIELIHVNSPFRGALTISFENHLLPESVEIYTMTGLRIMQISPWEVQQGEILLPDLYAVSPGIYLLRVKFKNGHVHSTKIIKL
jgi:endonuclease/exonuclease/phosphatase family metal-dependent hydrolase